MALTQLFKHSDQNMPPLTGQVGSLIVLLNALLVDGPGTTGIAITGITRSGTTATLTVSAADGKKLKTGQILTVSGATGGDASLYNGAQTITVASTTTATYTMGGTPTGTATGTILGSLALSVTSLTESGVNYTAVLAQANTTLAVGQWITFAGASPGGANIAMKINTVTDSTHVICTGPGSLGTITGTITYQRSPLAWTRPFTAGTNSQSYRSADATTNQLYLQVLDNGITSGGAREASVYGAEVLTADNTGTALFPTVSQQANGLCWPKSGTADATVRPWTLWGDGRTFYLQTGNTSTVSTWTIQYGTFMGFGHFFTIKAGDGFNTFVGGCTSFNNTQPQHPFSTMNSSSNGFSASIGLYVPRSYTQLSVAVAAGLNGFGGTVMGGVAVMPGPNPADGGYYFSPVFIGEPSLGMRGRLPGVYNPLHAMAGVVVQYDTISSVVGLSGIILTVLTGQSSGTGSMHAAVDTNGPWA